MILVMYSLFLSFQLKSGWELPASTHGWIPAVCLQNKGTFNKAGGVFSFLCVIFRYLCLHEFVFWWQWMKNMWQSDPCYSRYGVNGSLCSILIYLSEVTHLVLHIQSKCFFFIMKKMPEGDGLSWGIFFVLLCFKWGEKIYIYVFFFLKCSYFGRTQRSWEIFLLLYLF